MRITTLLFALLVAAYFIQGFAPVKCEHVFVEVEEPTVVVEPAHQVNNVYVIPPTGKHEGKPLICVKCFHIQKQILDYGKPAMPVPGSVIAGKGKAVICLEGPDSHETGVHYFTDSDRALIKKYNDSIKILPLRHRAKNSKKKIN